MEFQFCHNCGAKVASNAKFCGSCGTPVLKLTPAEPESAPVVEAPVIIPEPEPIATPEPVATQEPPKTKPAVVFTLDSLNEPIPEPEPEPVKPPVIFTLDSLTDIAPQQEPAAEVIAPPAQPEPVAVTPEVTPEPVPIAAAPVVVPEPEPVVETKPEPKAKPQRKPKDLPKKGILARRGVGRTILAVLLCILIFVWSFVTLTVLNVRLTTTGEQGSSTMTAVLEGVDLTQVPASLVVSDLENPDITLTDWIVGKITENYQGRVDADPEDLQEFLKESSVLPFLGQQLSEYINDIYNGTTDASITAAELEALLTADAAVIDDIFDEELSAEDITAISQAAVDSGALDLFNSEALRENNSQMFRIGQIALSWWVIGGMGVILLLLVLLLGAAERSVLRTLGDTGITLMVVSGIWGIGGLFVMLLPGVWESMLHAIRPIGSVTGALLEASLIPTAAAFGTGVVLVLIKVIGKAIVTKSAAKQA